VLDSNLDWDTACRDRFFVTFVSLSRKYRDSASVSHFLLNPFDPSSNTIRAVPGGKVNILGGHSIGHSKHKKCICTCVLFRTVSQVELFHCTIPKLLIRKRYYVLLLIPVFMKKLAQIT
jgi:hypothetical protein